MPAVLAQFSLNIFCNAMPSSDDMMWLELIKRPARNSHERELNVQMFLKEVQTHPLSFEKFVELSRRAEEVEKSKKMENDFTDYQFEAHQEIWPSRKSTFMGGGAPNCSRFTVSL